MSPKEKEKIKKVAHIVAAMAILLHAYHKQQRHSSFYIFFLIFGLLFLAIALFHHAIELKYPRVDSLFFGIEGILTLIISFENFQQDKIALGATYLFAASLQLLSIWIIAKKTNKKIIAGIE